MTEKPREIESDIVHLARVALTGRSQDVSALVQRVARKYRTAMPDMSSALSSLLIEAPTRASPLRRNAEVPMPVDTDSRLHLLRVEANPLLDHEPVFVPRVAQGLSMIVQERRNIAALNKLGLDPSKTCLFIGPPGVGKTMAAYWLARELSKPLMILDLAAVMSSYLGRTGTNLRHVLDYAKSTDCVLLVDELDAIAKRRDDNAEIGELKRLVTVLIQQLDDWPSDGLLIAATNHPDLLDPAIWRRFETKVEFPVPDQQTATQLINLLLAGHLASVGTWAPVLAAYFLGQSFSDIERELKSIRRASALSGVSVDEKLLGLVRSDAMPKADKIRVATLLVAAKIISQRQAHEMFGVSRDTIRKKSKSDILDIGESDD